MPRRIRNIDIKDIDPELFIELDSDDPDFWKKSYACSY